MSFGRVLIIVFGLGIVIYLGHFAWWTWLVSDATKIEWRLEEMAEAFNAGNTRNFMAGVADDYRDTDTDLDAETLRLQLISLFLRERDPQTKKFRHRVELDPGRVVEVEEGARQGTARLQARFFEVPTAGQKPRWVIDLEVNLEHRDSQWVVVLTRLQSVEGRRGF